MSSPSFSHSFLEDVLEVFCEHRDSIVLLRELLLTDLPPLFSPILGQYVTELKT